MRSEHAAALRLHLPHALERRLEAHAQRGLHSQCNAMLPRMQRLQTQHRVQKCTVVQIVLRGLGLSSALHSTEQYNTPYSRVHATEDTSENRICYIRRQLYIYSRDSTVFGALINWRYIERG